jgi:hypothetical protein
MILPTLEGFRLCLQLRVAVLAVNFPSPSPAVAALFGTLTTSGPGNNGPDLEPETPSAKAVCDVNPYAAPHRQVTKAQGYFEGLKGRSHPKCGEGPGGV